MNEDGFIFCGVGLDYTQQVGSWNWKPFSEVRCPFKLHLFLHCAVHSLRQEDGQKGKSSFVKSR